MQTIIEHENKILWLCITAFFLGLQYACISYSASTFFAGIIHENNIWVIYSIGATISLFFNFILAKILRNVKINNLLQRSIVLTILTTALIFYTTIPFFLVLEYILFYGLTSLTYTLLSVSLEEFSKNSSTGATRGIFNATVSSAYLLGPFISSFFIPNYGIKSVFIFSTVIGIVGFFIFRNYASITKQFTVHPQSTKGNLRRLFRNKDLLYITIAQLTLNAFYISMVVFLPFKLLALGISLTQYLSVLLPIALSPFLFIPPILGAWEDKMKNEKTIMILAFFGIIIALIFISQMTTTNLFSWAAIMFCARFCASSIETSTNSYFYKKVKADEVSIISTFVSMEYVAYVIFTPIFTLLYAFSDSDVVFLTVSFFFTFVLVLVSKIHNLAKHEEHKAWKEIWKRAKKRVA